MTTKPTAHFMGIALVGVAMRFAQCLFFNPHLHQCERPCRRQNGGGAEVRRPQKQSEHCADHADEDRIARSAKQAARDKRAWSIGRHADSP